MELPPWVLRVDGLELIQAQDTRLPDRALFGMRWCRPTRPLPELHTALVAAFSGWKERRDSGLVPSSEGLAFSMSGICPEGGGFVRVSAAAGVVLLEFDEAGNLPRPDDD